MRVKWTAVALLTAAAMCGGQVNASAAPTTTDAERIVNAVPGTALGVSSESPAVVSPTAPEVRVGEVSLRAKSAHKHSKRSKKGVAVTYQDTAKDTDTIVQTLGSGARILEVIRG